MPSSTGPNHQHERNDTMSTTQDIVAKLWNLCNVLRDDGVTYHQYVTELTYLLFLKMAEETGTEDRLPEGYRWGDLVGQSAPERLEAYKKLLIHLGSHGSRITREIFTCGLKKVAKSIYSIFYPKDIGRCSHINYSYIAFFEYYIRTRF